MQMFKILGNFVLEFIAICLIPIVFPFIFISRFRFNRNKKGVIREAAQDSFEGAFAIDVFFNAYGAPFWNWAFRKKNGYNFGNKDETISVAIAKNMYRRTLSRVGWFFATLIVIVDVTTWGKGGHFKGLKFKNPEHGN